MRLFVVNFHRYWGGQSSAVLSLAREMARRGHDVLVAGRQNSELVRRAAAAELPTYGDLELRPGFSVRSFRRDQKRLERIYRRAAPEGILTNGSQDTWACALARWRLRTPAFLVRWRHNTFKVAAHGFNRFLYRRLIDHVVVGSETVSPLLTANGLVDPRRITVFPYTTDLERFLNAKPGCAIKREMRVGDDGTLTLSIARLAPEKGHDTLIRAWRIVADRMPAAKLAIAGIGPARESLSRLISELGLEGHVRLLGFRDDVPSLYAEADLATLVPVAGESFGIALLEAYCTSTACVGTDVGGVKEMVITGRTGMLVPPGDVAKIADAVLTLLRNPGLRRRMGEAGRSRVTARFTMTRLGDAAEDLFSRLANRRANGTRN